MMCARIISCVLLAGTCLPSWTVADPGRLQFDFDPRGKFTFHGVVGERVAVNREHWLNRAPAANPGMLAMFYLRDRKPAPNLVPWAGEFVGKYLISAIQARRMTQDAQLDATVSAVVRELLASQADDGYAGPFPKQERLLGQWDLWGHYHIMLALLMWHEQTGDGEALQASVNMADLVCQTYLDSDRRMRDAGSSEMNLAIIHALGRLYRKTSHERYLQMMLAIQKDWESEGDYFRTGLAGTPFFQTPKPRWESLHNLQGLVELYRITGNQRYRTAFLNHWQSIRRWDRRNTGGFSSGEQATGTPYEPTPIETCCTIAWMALSVDALRLTGDAIVADELERSTYNGMLGAQHPSGSWWTYNTPMGGVREASDHAIVFQARAGTPDLNCCSVNGPRGIGMLSEWAVMRTGNDLVLNYYGPLQATVSLADGTPVTIRQQTRYPLNSNIKVSVQPKQPTEFTLHLRVPGWSRNSTITLADQKLVDADPGSYVRLHRTWQTGDEITLDFDMALRYESGDAEMAGRMSVYRGPLLLAYDQLLNTRPNAKPPQITPKNLESARVSLPSRDTAGRRAGIFPPWILVDLPLATGETVRLCDFASAGSSGCRYESWLPAQQLAPPAPLPAAPVDGQAVPAGIMLFKTRRSIASTEDSSLQLMIATDPEFQDPVVTITGLTSPRIILTAAQTGELQPNVDYYWQLVAENEFGATTSHAPAKRFHIDPDLPPLGQEDLTEFGEDPHGIIVRADLQGDPEPSYGTLLTAQGWKPAGGPGGQKRQAVELDGEQGMLRYQLRAFPSCEFSVGIWFCLPHAEEGLGQLFSAWCRGMDDPLRICVEDARLSARIEAGQVYSTQPVPIDVNVWYHVTVVKQDDSLTLYLDGQPVSTIPVPAAIHSAAEDFAVGGNPHYTGANEHLACRVSQLFVSARAMTAKEIRAVHQPQQ